MNFQELNKKGMGMYIDLDKYGLSSFALKIIAVVTMLIDHIAMAFLAQGSSLYMVMRSIGRLSFPIYCFLLVEGFYHTRDKKKHLYRLLLFAVVSEVPYDMIHGHFINLLGQSVMVGLLIGYIMIWILYNISMFRIRYPKILLKVFSFGTLNWITQLIAVFGAMGLAYMLKVTYSYTGILLIFFFYTFREYHIGKAIGNMVFNMEFYSLGIQWLGSLSVIPIAFYNGKRGKYKWKWFFYLFYPVHLFVLAVIKIVVY